MESIVHQLKDLAGAREMAALATLIHVDGSSYRKTGATMIITEDGRNSGMISGGCLEEDLCIRAQALFNTGQSEIHRYDLSSEDDLGWGIAAGCNGVVSVLIRDVDLDFRSALRRAIKCLENREPVLFIQSVDGRDYAFYSRQEGLTGTLGFRYTDHLAEVLDAAAPFAKLAEIRHIQNERVYMQIIWPEPALHLFGAGHDARPVAELAARTGYAVHVYDWRESLCSAERFPTARTTLTGDLKETLRPIRFTPYDAAVIMTHDFNRDRELLEHLSREPLGYLGVLGSKKRTERLIGGPLPSGIHSPVGLSIGADGPEEIAVSIVSELIAVRERKYVWKP